MRLAPKLIIFLVATLIVVVLALLYLRFTQKETLNFIFSDRKDQREVVVNTVIDLRGNSLSTLANDYTYWDEMVDFVNNRDQEWAIETLDPALETFAADAIWVYDLQNKLVYSVNKQGDETVHNKEIYLPESSRLSAFAQNRLLHFYAKTGSGLMEIRGATIHPTSDPGRTTEPQGYFFAGRFLSNEYLLDISEKTNSKISVVEATSGTVPQTVEDLKKGKLTFFIPLDGVDNQPVGYYKVDNEFLTVSQVNSTNDFNFIVFIVLVGLTGVAFVLVILFARNANQRALKLSEKTGQLIEEQTKLQASINSLNVGFIVTDRELNIKNINSTAKLLLCLAERSANSKPGVLVDPLAINQDCTIADIDEQLKQSFDFRGHLEKCLREQKMVDIGEVEFRNLFLHIFMSPIVMFESSKLKVLGTVIVVEDTTQKTALERAKDEFFSIASHELRTPLTSIRGNTSLIRDYYGRQLQEDSRLSEMVDDIHESSIRLIQIVNDFLDTSRLQQGRMVFTKTDFDFKKVAEEVVSELSALAKERQLTLAIEADKDLPEVTADRNRIKQVLINLVGNSLKFTEKGGVTIKLNIRGEFLKIAVVDTGRGIEPENQKLLFRKFQQASSSLYTRDTTKGTGLGLYISKLIVEAMGGSIGLESSKPGEGSTFSFTLPFVKPVIES